MNVELAVVVLNYRTAGLTVACLASLEEETGPGVRVVVVDNASGDGSAEQIEAAIAQRGWSSWATLLRSAVNGGFAAGNNLGIRSLDAAAYVLLNSDTVVRRGALAALRDAMRVHPGAGVIGAGLLTAHGEVDHSAFRRLSPLSELVRAANTGLVSRALQRHDPFIPPPPEPFEPDWVGFACVPVRREVIERVGLLDEGYFMYFEDLDYCRRVAADGWKILYWPSAKVVHLHGASSQVTKDGQTRRRAPRYFYEARARYYAKFYGRAGLWVANALWCAGRGVSLLRGLTGRSAALRDGEATDIWINAADPLRRREMAR